MYWILVKLPSLFLPSKVTAGGTGGHGVERYGGEHITEATFGMDWRSSNWPPAKRGSSSCERPSELGKKQRNSETAKQNSASANWAMVRPNRAPPPVKPFLV